MEWPPRQPRRPARSPTLPRLLAFLPSDSSLSDWHAPEAAPTLFVGRDLYARQQAWSRKFLRLLTSLRGAVSGSRRQIVHVCKGGGGAMHVWLARAACTSRTHRKAESIARM